MAVLTDLGEENTLRWLTNQSPTVPTLPYMVRLLTSMGTDSVAGTEGTGLPAQQFTLGAPTADAGDGTFYVANTAVMRYENSHTSSQTIVGVELWDSAATPLRWAYGALVTDIVLAAGSPFEFDVGKLRLKIR